MNWAGDSHDAYSVIIDSALGVVGAAPKNNDEFLGEVKWLQEYLREQGAAEVSRSRSTRAQAAAGKAVFDAQLRELPRERQDRHAHAARRGSAPIRERIWTWNKDNAIAANKVVKGLGSNARAWSRTTLVGYNPPFLDGIWLRAPYLHNGSVPTLRDLLEPRREQRPKVFWRGYDLYDPVNVGFVSQGEEAKRSARGSTRPSVPTATRATPSAPVSRPATRMRSSST